MNTEQTSKNIFMYNSGSVQQWKDSIREKTA